MITLEIYKLSSHNYSKKEIVGLNTRKVWFSDTLV